MRDSPSPGSARDETIHDRLMGMAAAAGRRWPRSPCWGEACDGNLVSRRGAESPRSAVASFCLLPPRLSSPMAKPGFGVCTLSCCWQQGPARLSVLIRAAPRAAGTVGTTWRVRAVPRAPQPAWAPGTQQWVAGKGELIVNQAQRHPSRLSHSSPVRAISKRNLFFFLIQRRKVQILFQLTKGLRCPESDSHASK